jgi:WD40 repeat protein
LLGGWLRRRAVARLQADGSAEAMRVLADAAAEGGVLRRPALAALARLAADGNTPAREALCRLVLYHDDRDARATALQAGYAPHEETRRALFYFLTEQWKEYEGLDFDHQLLRAAHATADHHLRRRIADRARHAGRLEWVEVVAGGRQGQRLAAMTAREWKTALTVLTDARRADDLWRLAQEAPPRWSARLLHALGRLDWSPARGDHAGFRELLRLANLYPDDDLTGLLSAGPILTGHEGGVRCLALHPAGRLAATGGDDHTVRLWALPDGKLLRTCEGHRAAVTCLAVTPDGRTLASGSKDHRVFLWHLPDGERVRDLEGHDSAITCMAVTPDGKALASAAVGGGVQLWKLPGGDWVRLLEGHDRAVQSLAVSPDGRWLATASADCTVRLWELPEGRAARTLEGHRTLERDAVLCLAFCPDGRTLASGGTDGCVRLWSVPGGGLERKLPGHQGAVTTLAVGPTGDVLLAGSEDQTIRIWRLPDGRMLHRLCGHCGPVTGLALADEGRLAASVSGAGWGPDHSVRLWRLPEGAGVKTLNGHHRGVNALAFYPDGRLLVTASADGTARVWTAELARLAELPAGRATFDDLARAEALRRADTLLEAEERALDFIVALLRWRRRGDIVVEDAAPRVLDVGEFDIEIDG